MISLSIAGNVATYTDNHGRVFTAAIDSAIEAGDVVSVQILGLNRFFVIERDDVEIYRCPLLPTKKAEEDTP